MQLIGYLDSPYVRRVAISATFLGVDFEHRELSIFRDVEEFRRINPLIKVPTLVCDDGAVLVESTLIIDHLESMSSNDVRLTPVEATTRRHVLKCTGEALVAMEKGVQLIYETRNRPPELHHGPWRDRIRDQLRVALDLMEANAGQAAPWMSGDSISQADISTAVAFRFIAHKGFEGVDLGRYASLQAHSRRAEARPEFRAWPLGD